MTIRYDSGVLVGMMILNRRIGFLDLFSIVLDKEDTKKVAFFGWKLLWVRGGGVIVGRCWMFKNCGKMIHHLLLHCVVA